MQSMYETYHTYIFNWMLHLVIDDVCKCTAVSGSKRWLMAKCCLFVKRYSDIIVRIPTQKWFSSRHRFKVKCQDITRLKQMNENVPHSSLHSLTPPSLISVNLPEAMVGSSNSDHF